MREIEKAERILEALKRVSAMFDGTEPIKAHNATIEAIASIEARIKWMEEHDDGKSL